jgi:hypothetical protein
MTKVLLVWEEIPESTKFFMLDGELAELALKAHHCFINMVDGDPNEYADQLNCKLVELEIEPIDISSPIDIKEPCTVCLAGFLM